MMVSPIRGRAMAVLTLCAAWSAAATAQPRAIDSRTSSMTVRVYRAGVLSFAGHNHEIAAPVARGTVDTSGRRVELYVNSGLLQVRDPEASDKDRAEIQSTMLGPQVLDAQRYPEIAFRSTAVATTGAGAWRVQGDLSLHGQTHPVTVEVKQTNGRFTGSAEFRQTEFGITPVKVAGGTIRVKDEVRLEFDIQLAP